MSEQALEAPGRAAILTPEAAAGDRRPRRGRRRWTGRILPIYTGVVMLYLVLPILVMIMYTFNQSSNSRVTLNWQGFTIYWWLHTFDVTDTGSGDRPGSTSSCS